jgi:hypothetical protein
VNRKETNETNCVLLLFYFGKDKSTAIQEEKKASYLNSTRTKTKREATKSLKLPNTKSKKSFYKKLLISVTEV